MRLCDLVKLCGEQYSDFSIDGQCNKKEVFEFDIREVLGLDYDHKSDKTWKFILEEKECYILPF